MSNSNASHFFAQRKVLITCVLILLLLLLWPTGLRLLFPTAEELSYHAGLEFTTCSGFLANESIDSERCRTDYSISIGNTGSVPQALIELELTPVPATWRLGVSVTDIVASAREKISPQIEHLQSEDSLRISISNLQPNRLVELQLMTIGAEAAEILASTVIALSAQGSVIETDPQLTAVARFMRGLFAIFGI